MIRNVAGGIAGLLAAGIVIMAVLILGMSLFPLPPELEAEMKAAMDAKPPDFTQMNVVAQKVPFVNVFMVLLSYVIGSIAGGFAATAIATRASRPWPALVVGGLLTVAGTMNLMGIPHPLWFAIASTLCYVPCALLGCALVMVIFRGQAPPVKGSPQA